MTAHNNGKSTTARRLALAGYPLLCDGMIFLPSKRDGLMLVGFPVGKIKLREDMVARFPGTQSLFEAEEVREETKYSFDLRRFDLGLVYEEAAHPVAIELCLLVHGDGKDTNVARASHADVMQAVMENSLFYDRTEFWQRTLDAIDRLIRRAQWHHPVIGSDPQHLIATIGGL